MKYLIHYADDVNCYDVTKDFVKDFVKLCCEKLGIAFPFTLEFVKYRKGDMTTAYYNPTSHEVCVAVNGRSLVDILRSVAHELVHHYQNQEQDLSQGVQDIGGEIEDEANALAGQLIKIFTKVESNIEVYDLPFCKPSGDRSKGCLMLDLDFPNWDKIISKIKPEDLLRPRPDLGIEEPLQTEPHTTVLYGFDMDDFNWDEFHEFTNNKKNLPYTLHVNNISCFDNPNYDVLKFDVVSPELHDLNEEVKTAFKHTSTFPNYKPHITIAYLKKGTGKKYIKELNKPLVLKSNKFKFSFPKSAIKYY